MKELFSEIGADSVEGRGVDRLRWVFDARSGPASVSIARWIFLRALGAIYFSAFYSLLFQIKGLIGRQGILPAGSYLAAVSRYYGSAPVWHAPTLFWISSSAAMLMAVTWAGLAASVLGFANVWPRASFLVCFVCFLSFVAAAGDFSSYQSDGMLLEAGFLSLFFAPRGLWPGLAAGQPPSRASLFLLQWEWFRIYFESGLVKILSGDEQWRNFTAMDEYYQNSPLPTWIGWYVEHLPHWFHAGTVALTFVLEFAVVLLLFFPPRVRRVCFWIVTMWEIGVILTGNYAFLNYLVLSLGFLLLDDGYWRRLVPARWRPEPVEPAESEIGTETTVEMAPAAANENGEDALAGLAVHPRRTSWRARLGGIGTVVSAIVLSWIGYATTAQLVDTVAQREILPVTPVRLLEPFRVANRYGLFAVMTRGRYEIEFQGSNDGVKWQPYLFRNKPQLLEERPGIYAPYQPRFDWNLWFASLGEWRQNEIVPLTEERLLEGEPEVTGLFRSDPFAGARPRYVRAVLWRYWLTTLEEKRATGNWWKRSLMGVYAPELTRGEDGTFEIVVPADDLPAHD
jgi:hypothetical protein